MADNENGILRTKVNELEIEIVRLQEQKKAAAEALIIARAALDHNQSVSNEWRKENIDQRALYMTTEKAQGLINGEAQERRALEGRVSILEKAGSQGEGRHNAFDSLWTRAIGLALLLVALAGLIAKLVLK